MRRESIIRKPKTRGADWVGDACASFVCASSVPLCTRRRSPVGLARTLSKTVITTYGRDYVVTATLFHRSTAPGKVGRQMQTWV